MSKIKSKAAKVKIKDTEKVRKRLIEKKAIDNSLNIFTKKGFSYIPIKKGEIKNLKSLDIVDAYFSEHKKRDKSYKEIIDLSRDIKSNLPSSFDIIGDIALVKLDKDIKKYKRKIGKAILTTNKNIKTVCMVKPVSGKYRTRDIEIIAGEKKTNTIHREFGLSLLVDIKKVYFSPRLANERKRIADLTKNNEIVVDMFTGVAPFSIMIAKYSNPKKIYAVDKNKKAIELAKINIRRNKVYDKVRVIHGDSKNIKNLVFKKEDFNVNRVIMNLPFSSFDFFTSSLSLIKEKCFIHYYEVLSEEQIEKRVNTLKKLALKENISLTNLKINKIKSYSPREFYISIDITAKKKYTADVA